MALKPETLLYKLQQALAETPPSFDVAEDAATQYRQMIAPLTAQAVTTRGDVAMHLACTLFNGQEFARAEAWALRALQTKPRPDAFCLLGELAYLNDDVEGALAWFTAAETVARPWEDHAMRAFWDTARQRIERLRIQHFTELTQRRSAHERTHTHGLILLTVGNGKGEPRDTLAATCESIAAQSTPWTAGPRILVIDGELRKLPAQLTGWGNRPTASPRNEGQARTLFRALELAHRERWDCVTILEDDIALAPNAFAAMQAMAIPKKAAVMAWYSNAPMPFASIGNVRPRYVFQQMPCAATGVAITLPFATIDAVLSSVAYQAWTTPHGGDGIFSQVLPGKYWATVYPNCVQHTGVASLTGNTQTGPRLSPSFDNCVDAMRLFDR